MKETYRNTLFCAIEGILNTVNHLTRPTASSQRLACVKSTKYRTKVTITSPIEFQAITIALVYNQAWVSKTLGTVHKVRHARGGGVREGATVCARGGGQEHETSRL